jgi:hypothetical protein
VLLSCVWIHQGACTHALLQHACIRHACVERSATVPEVTGAVDIFQLQQPTQHPHIHLWRHQQPHNTPHLVHCCCELMAPAGALPMCHMHYSPVVPRPVEACP